MIDGSLGQGRLGILGGMGSEATAYFLRILAQRSSATIDQEHVPFVLLSCPEILDRSQSVETDDTNVPATIDARLRQLEKAGCGAVAMPCNTAHYWRHEFASSLSIPLIDMVSATAQRAALLGAGNALVLGTRSTIKYRLYDNALQNVGVRLIEIGDDIVDLTHIVITLAKTGEIDHASQKMAHLLQACQSRHPNVIILGCTELPIVLSTRAQGNDLIDSVSCLADACIKWWQSKSETQYNGIFKLIRQ
ncbi:MULTISPECIES: aspartate/glutamate racemase family protein [Mycetohabitans]|uniref:aspartate/glutamate racemase family protein n=1 Tax=Mycetohabitans TaxID=2571159 RepID=UPI001F19484F|nr:amino acid racemase [Mycetohabitans sp. B3]MCF2134028.1 amino acid racemase [Mycetohabitans sp. B3]